MDIKDILEKARKATPGPWSACGKGGCSCGLISSDKADGPVAEIIHGKWGDDYPALRFTKDSSSLSMKVEAYMEQITYGEVSNEIAKSNAQYIASLSPDVLIPILEKYLEMEEENKALGKKATQRGARMQLLASCLGGKRTLDADEINSWFDKSGAHQ